METATDKKTEKKRTNEEMLEMISLVKNLILLGKLKTSKTFPLEQLLDENITKGGDTKELVIEFGKAMQKAKKGEIVLHITDEDITGIMGEEAISITELPESSIEFILNHKPKKGAGELSLTLKITLADQKEEPELNLSVKLSGKNMKQMVPFFKDQFLWQNRIGFFVEKLALNALIKANNLKKPAINLFIENMEYTSQLKALKEKIAGETNEVIWLYAEEELKSDPKFKNIPGFQIIVGLDVTDKLTLYVKFKTTVIKKTEA